MIMLKNCPKVDRMREKPVENMKYDAPSICKTRSKTQSYSHQDSFKNRWQFSQENDLEALLRLTKKYTFRKIINTK